MHRYYIINNIVEFHPTTRQLRNLINPTQMVVLNSPASRCLLLLIESSNTIVTQQEFMYNVWEKLGLVVSANTYYQNICLLRKGLKEVGFPADPITTIPRIGLTLARETQVQVIESADVLPIANVEEAKTEEGARPVHHDTPDSADSDHIGSLRASEPVSGIVAAVPDIPAEQSLNNQTNGIWISI
ncbi:winged helix-turn-helix domain-containing protein, partial [Raoultella ornithinolytica]|uniref:winged helix-turn-helix domain-containing protein n=1 Tax=Raoultella ornithinolytica TaxID=54291 RepID=UPI002DE86E62